jgi:hypothetical protein
MKNFPRYIPRNPLISLDPDERIQGNPTPESGVFKAKQPRAKKFQTNPLRCREDG